MGDARGALRQGGGAFGAGRREPRTPMRQRLMRSGEPSQHFEILAAAEPFAQALGFLGPHPAEARPQWLDQFHLIAQLDDALAQRVQIDRIGPRPVSGNAPPCAAITVGELRGDARKIERIERPGFDCARCCIEPGEYVLAQRRR